MFMCPDNLLASMGKASVSAPDGKSVSISNCWGEEIERDVISAFDGERQRDVITCAIMQQVQTHRKSLWQKSSTLGSIGS